MTRFRELGQYVFLILKYCKNKFGRVWPPGSADKHLNKHVSSSRSKVNPQDVTNRFLGKCKNCILFKLNKVIHTVVLCGSMTRAKVHIPFLTNRSVFSLHTVDLKRGYSYKLVFKKNSDAKNMNKLTIYTNYRLMCLGCNKVWCGARMNQMYSVFLRVLLVGQCVVPTFLLDV